MYGAILTINCGLPVTFKGLLNQNKRAFQDGNKVKWRNIQWELKKTESS